MRTSHGYSIVGGLFGLAENDNRNFHPPFFLSGNCIKMADARSAIWLLITQLQTQRVWIPSYLCTSIKDAVNQAGAIIDFYPVNYDLKAVAGNWLDELGKDDLVIMIDYFGFPYDFEVAQLIKQKDAWLLEDASQSLLTCVEKKTIPDFIVYSPRKFIGVPDGGILEICTEKAKRADDWTGETLNDAPGKWWDLQIRAAKDRHRFDLEGGERQWFQLFKKGKSLPPIGPYAMSNLTFNLLQKGFDYTEISAQRKANYRALAGRLSDIAVFPKLPSGVVPQGFPIRLTERDQLLQALFAKDVYPPVHWPIRGAVPDSFRESHRLADEIMTIPCDQRYTISDMDMICDIIQNFN